MCPAAYRAASSRLAGAPFSRVPTPTQTSPSLRGHCFSSIDGDHIAAAAAVQRGAPQDTVEAGNDLIEIGGRDDHFRDTLQVSPPLNGNAERGETRGATSKKMEIISASELVEATV